MSAKKRLMFAPGGAPTMAFRSIFSPRTAAERDSNFETYFEFSKRLSGELIETDKDLTIKRARLRYFQDNAVRSHQPLADPESFYRNYVELIDDPKQLDPKALVLCCIYKFA